MREHLLFIDRIGTQWAYRMMIQRCYNPKNPAYKSYGGRGITVCERWRIAFSNFVDDMGYRPLGLFLDREDNDGNYEPNNCRWVTREVSDRNKRLRRTQEFYSPPKEGHINSC